MNVPGASSRPCTRALLAALLLLLGGLLLAPMLAYPFGSDHGSFATTADVLRRGGALYRDVAEIKPPGVYYLFAVAFATLGRTMFAIRLLDLLWTLAAATVLFAVGRRLLSPAAGIVGAFCFLTFYALNGDYWHTAQCDGFASLPLALAASFTLWAEERRSAKPALVAGAMVGLAMLLKFTLAAFLFVPLLAAVLSRSEPVRSRALRVSAYAAGCVLPVALAALLLWRAGTLDDMWQIVVVWNSQYGQMRVGGAIPKMFRFLLGGKLAILPVIGLFSLAGVVSLVLARRARPSWWFLPAWVVVTVVGLAVQGKFFEYHWLPLLLPVGLLAGEGLVFAISRLRAAFGPAGGRAITWACTAGLVALTVSGYWAHFQRPIAFLAGRMPRESYLSAFVSPNGYFSFSADAAVADYVRSHTAPDDSLFVWGLEPLVYFLADRPPASRFIHSALLIPPWTPEAWREMALEDLRRTRPKLLLLVHSDVQPWATAWGGDSYSFVGEWPGLRDFIVGGYRPVEKMEDFDVWERK
jgi:hypothetical protein